MFRVFSCLTVEHDTRLVVLAGAVCLLASLAAIDLFRRAHSARGRRRWVWIATAGAAGGSGIWATHLIAMLAYQPGFPVAYDARLTASALVFAMAMTALGLGVAVRQANVWNAPLSGVIIGLGVAGMHYLGISALEVPGEIEWAGDLVALSLTLGISLSSVAIFVALSGDSWRNWIGATALLTSAIIALHFTAMAAVQIIPDPARAVDAFAFSPHALAVAIAGVAVAVLGISLMAAFADRRLASQAGEFVGEIDELRAAAAQQQEHLLRLGGAIDQMPQGLCIFDAEQRIVVANAGFARNCGLKPGQLKEGLTLAEIDELRFAAGSLSFSLQFQGYDARAPQIGALEFIEEAEDGKVVSFALRSLPGGGTIMFNEDVTERDRELRGTRASLIEARAKAEQAAQLAQSALARLRDAVEAVPEGFVLFDAEDRHVLWNARYAEIYSDSRCSLYQGMPFEDLVRSKLAAGLYQESHGKEEIYLHDRLAKHKASENSFVQQLTDGRWLQVAERRTSDGGAIGVHVDITQLKQRESSFRLLLESNPIPMVVYDRKTLAFLVVNRATVEHYGYSQEQFLTMTLLDIFPSEEWDRIRNVAATPDDASRRGLNWRHILADGTQIEVATYARVLQYEGHDAVMVAVFDITERQRAEKRIAYLARHDLLTDLPNRAEFNERLLAAIEGSVATKPPFAVLCLNLDRFKEVNDVYGHAVGDEVLRETSRRFTTVTDGAFLARVGADEFAVIIIDDHIQGAAVECAEALLATMASPFHIGEHRINIGVSIGVAMFPNDGAAASVLANANAALFRAKSEGRGTACFFDAVLDVRIRERHLLLQDLERALERRELHLHYQPQAGKNGEIVGFEALLRWIHPTRGFVSPDAFIPVAEDSGLIIQIGQWVLEEACREAASWPQPLNIAVNLSPVQFRQDDLPQAVHSILLETGLAANRLELEITEGSLVADFSRATSILRRLKSLGARIAMDDFGTGYSSLSYLQAFPFDKIKIDRSFVSGEASKPQSEAIIRAITGLGRGLGLPVIAEGVETEEQRIFLLNEGCEELQGYLIGRPRPIEDYAHFVGRAPTLMLSAC